MKKIKKIKFVNLDEFNGFIEGKTLMEFYHTKLVEDNKNIDGIIEQNSIHNQINRITGTTLDNGLFTLNEKFIDGNLEIFFKVRKDYNIEELEEVLKDFERSGFGKKSSSGKGSFKILDFEKFDGFKQIKNGNAFITLSNYIPKKGDYEEVI
jgi:CRISPR type III-A-associated RAMP protein Csm4